MPERDCTDDNIRITFASTAPRPGEIVQVTGDNVFRYRSFTPGMIVPVVLVMETSSDRVSGWSVGVGSDERFLSLMADGLIMASTDAEANFGTSPFVFNRVSAGGFVSGVVLSQGEPTVVLPVQENSLLRVNYSLDAEPTPSAESLLEFKHGELLGDPNSPPINITLSIANESKVPHFLTNARIVKDPAAEICDNAIDDNGDGQVDCDDSQCAGFPICQPQEICDNGVDDDNDGRVDCADPVCSDLLRCQPEICDNTIDDNDDGLIDCGDPQCIGFPTCQLPEICDNSIDDNGDGLVDCGDAQCTAFPGCERVSDPTLRVEFCANLSPPPICSDDDLQITFAASESGPGEVVRVTGDNVFRYFSFAAGMIIPMVVVMETSSANVQGWAIAVGSDERFLSIPDDGLIIENTDTRAAVGPFPFVVNRVVTGGFLSAIILDQTSNSVLPVKENTIIRVNYSLDAEPPPGAGTLVEFKNKELATEGSPPVEIGMTVRGQTFVPNSLTDGRVVHDPEAEDCDNGQDDNGDGLVDCDDAQCLGFPSCRAQEFIRCDPNNDGKLDLADPIRIINNVFRGKNSIECVSAYDCNGTNGIEDALANIVFMLQYYFMGSGRPPPAPFPNCGNGDETEKCVNRLCS